MRVKFGVVILAAVALLLFQDCTPVSRAQTPVQYDAQSVYSYAEDAVFYVRAYREDGTLKDTGSGFLIRPDGTAVTAYHVVEGAARLGCVLNDGSEATCRILVLDEAADTAVLELPAAGKDKPYPYLSLRTGPVKQGAQVFAIGYPLKGTKIITEGIVNAPDVPINGRERVLISATLVNGMSGGPLIDQDGSAAGLLSGSLRTMSGIHLAVDAEVLKRVVNRAGSER
ncbi:serine protease [Paenibacillus sp. MMS20-IR301]|uniref:S1 family peptidase n=1 Tax=Paenibacillus sp. MMS20-IR301 TaxID=2895946 RepID=UPI0028EC7A13|nr:serine protease [Paenibacillus sp. MMS20-IR301]WNS46424.1 serine protease [Paenibacillus sp. MMS20-IR301]